MSTLKLIQFSGEIPRMIPRLLPDTAAQRAENVRLDNGGLTPVRQTRLAATIAGIPEGQVRTIFKHGEDWLAWDKVVHAVPGPVAQDRLYYTGDGKPKMRVAGAVYDLAVPFPSAALTATLSGTGSGDIITRLYVYTFVTDFDEESEPCPISNSVDWQAGKTVTLSGFAAPPAGRAITKQRIYRLQMSIATGADLFFIAERPVSTADFVDNIGIDDFAEVLPSRDWNAPPENLKGLISLPNGGMAGFVGKDLYFCEPFRPHAWPEKYVLTTTYNIVGLGAFGNTIVVTTEGQPEIVTGIHPDSMVQEKMEINLPCINARGIVDLGYAVAYPSHGGLVVVDSAGPRVATEQLMTRNDWLKTGPGAFVAGQFSGRYFASFEYLEANGQPSSGTFIIDLSGETPFLLRGSRKADAMHYDVASGSLYMLDGLSILEWDALGQVNEIMTWRSKQFVLPAPSSFGCVKIEANNQQTPEEQAAQEAERVAQAARNAAIFAQATIGGEINGSPYNSHTVNGDDLERLTSGQFTSVSIFADGKLAATVSDINTVVRLPPIDRAINWEVAVNGTAEIAQITLATAPRELNTI